MYTKFLPHFLWDDNFICFDNYVKGKLDVSSPANFHFYSLNSCELTKVPPPLAGSATKKTRQNRHLVIKNA